MSIRSKGQKPKLERNPKGVSASCGSDQYPWISFRYMTASKDHSIKFLDSLESSERNDTVMSLYKRLEEISQSPWSVWMNQCKRTGLETIYCHQLKFSPGGGISLTKDTAIYVFRCDTYRGKGQGRIIGFKASPCSTLHIIGYDFDFSAYEH